MDIKDYYNIMGLDRNASQDEITRAAYDELGVIWNAGQKFHPAPDRRRRLSL